MSNRSMLQFLRTETKHLEQAGLLRNEIISESATGPNRRIRSRTMLDFCSTDYLGLANDKEVKRAAAEALDTYGAGACSPRLVTGSTPLHAKLEQTLASYLQVDDALVLSSGYHASTSLFESLVNEKDFVFCDAHLQPSLADGLRLCRGRILPYRHHDMRDLEDRLRRSRGARFRIIVTDGVFPLDGSTASLHEICALAEKYDALVFLEDSHGLGVLGENGRGTAELQGVGANVDLICGSFGHALGGGEGGFVAGRKEVVTWLRQKARPYLGSPALSPAATASAQKAVEIVTSPRGRELRERLISLTLTFRSDLESLGFTLLPGEHPTVLVLTKDAVKTQRMADALFKKGLYVMGFCHPVVPEGAARLQAHLSAAHAVNDVHDAATRFRLVEREVAPGNR